MYNSQRHLFTTEFDDVCILISLDMGITSASMQVTISEPNGLWGELVPLSIDTALGRQLLSDLRRHASKG